MCGIYLLCLHDIINIVLRKITNNNIGNLTNPILSRYYIGTHKSIIIEDYLKKICKDNIFSGIESLVRLSFSIYKIFFNF